LDIRLTLIGIAGSGVVSERGYVSYLFFKLEPQNRFTFSGDLSAFF